MQQAATPGAGGDAAVDAGAGGCSGAMEAGGHPPEEGPAGGHPHGEGPPAEKDDAFAAAPSELLPPVLEERRDVLAYDGRISTKRLKVGRCMLTALKPTLNAMRLWFQRLKL